MKNKCFISLVIFFTIPIFLLAQNTCSDTSFKKLYSSPNSILINYHYIVNSNDTGFLSGRVIDTIANDTAIYISKIEPLGNVYWAKKIKFPSLQYWQLPNNIIELPNGDIILLLFAQNDTTINLVKLKTDGSLAWAKSIKGLSDETFNTCNLFFAQNELYISCVSNPNTGPDDGNWQNSIIKFDTDGNILWSRYYGKNYECSSSTPIGLIVNNDSLIVFGRMFAAGCSNPTIGFPDRERTYFGMKVNKFNGAMGKSVSYTSPRELAPNGVPGLYLFSFTATGNNLLYFSTRFQNEHNFNNASNYKYGGYKVRFDTSLNTYEGSLYYHTEVTLPSLNKIDVDLNGNSNIVFYSSSASNNTSQFIGKFSPNNTIIRQKRLTTPNNTQSNYAGRNPFARKRNYISLVTNFKNNNSSYLQLTQFINDEQNSSCFGADTNFIKTAPFLVTIYSSSFFDADYNLPLRITDLSATIAPLNIIKEDFCEQISVCNSITVTGADTACNANQIYSYKAHLNNACAKHVFWEIDTTAISLFDVINDTTVNIRFNKNWAGYLYASVNSCTNLKDSIKINALISPDSVNLGSDKVLCTGDQLILNAKSGFKSYLWQNGSTDSTFTVIQSGSYFVTASDYCNNDYSDTINIVYNQPSVIRLGNDTSICNNNSLLLSAGTNFTNYLWSTGANTQIITVNSIGEYRVTATNIYGCVSRDTIKIIDVFPSPVLALNKQTTLCLNQNNILNAGSGYASYLWQNGVTDSSIIVTSPGFYKITVGNNYNCFASDSIKILKIAMPPINFLDTALAICRDDTIHISPHGLFNEYLWNTGSISNAIRIYQPGIYWLLVRDKNSCVGSDTIKVSIKDCSPYFYIPNAFTPNKDSRNDTFGPIITGQVSEYFFAIYNRYGQLVFSSKQPNIGWDGTIKGLPQNAGVFVWYCNYKLKNEPAKFAKGTLMLIR